MSLFSEAETGAWGCGGQNSKLFYECNFRENMVKGLWLTCTWKYDIKPEGTVQAARNQLGLIVSSLHLKKCKKVPKYHKWWPRIWTVLQQFHADGPVRGNHQFRPGELCLQNKTLRWCWPYTPSHTTTFSYWKAKERTNLDCLSVLRRPLDSDTKQRRCASSLLCSWLWVSSQEGILPRGSEHSLDSDQNQFHKVIFSSYKVFAITQYYQLRNVRIQTTSCVPVLRENYL